MIEATQLIVGLSSQATQQSVAAAIQQGNVRNPEVAAKTLEAVATTPWTPFNLLGELATLTQQTPWLAATTEERRAAILAVVPRAATETLSALERT